MSVDIRLIVHRSQASLLLCYVDYHDRAYDWAERRKLETHPKTGAAQLVEIRETVKEVVVPVYVQAEMPAPPKPRLFAGKSDEELLSYGVPAEWLDDVRRADEDSLLLLAERLPGEPKRFWNWPRVARRGSHSHRRRSRIRSIIPMPSADSA